MPDSITRRIHPVDVVPSPDDEALFESTQKKIRKWIKRRRSGQNYQSLEQTTAFLDHAYVNVRQRHKDSAVNEDEFAARVLVAVKRLMIDDYRKGRAAKRGKGTTGHSFDEQRDGLERSQDLEWLEIREEIKALGQSSKELGEGEAIVLKHFLEGRSLKECADVLGVSVSTATRRMEHFLDVMRRRLTDREGEY